MAKTRLFERLAATNRFVGWLFMLRKVFLTKSWKKYYSQYGEDIVYDRVIRMKQKGFFVDVGCFHPTKYSNTYKLYRFGWRGINIDLDEVKINAFNLRRPSDTNVLCAVSETESECTLYSAGFYTLVQTLDPKTAEKMRKSGLNITERKVKTRPLSSIIDGTTYKDRKIDILSIDVEGVEMMVLRSLDFERYCPKLIVVEYHGRSLEELMDSDLYKFLKDQGYSLYNWTGPTLHFIHPRE